MRKLFSVLVIALLAIISVPLVLGALTFQRDIYSNGTTASYNWNNRTLSLTAFGTPRMNVQLSVTANSTIELTGINWGTNIPVININNSRGYVESAHAQVTLTNVGNVPVNVNLNLVSYSIAIPQTTIRVFWGMHRDSVPAITLQLGQTVHPALTIAIVSNTPAHATAPFSVHVTITATQAPATS